MGRATYGKSLGASGDDALQKLRALIKPGTVAMVTATDRRFMPASRPLLMQALDEEGVLWFFVPSDGSLALDIESNPRVSATYSDELRGVYVSLSGYARLVYDPERIFGLWDERVEAWFSQGPLDPRLSLLRVDVDHAEYWEERSRRRIRLLALAQAALGGETHAPQHRRVQLRGRRSREAWRA